MGQMKTGVSENRPPPTNGSDESSSFSSVVILFHQHLYDACGIGLQAFGRTQQLIICRDIGILLLCGILIERHSGVTGTGQEITFGLFPGYAALTGFTADADLKRSIGILAPQGDA